MNSKQCYSCNKDMLFFPSATPRCTPGENNAHIPATSRTKYPPQTPLNRSNTLYSLLVFSPVFERMASPRSISPPILFGPELDPLIEVR